MILDELISKLLYVPFNDDYKVIPEIKTKLTEDVFFDRCFIKPAFDEEIENALKNTGIEVDDFELDLDKKDIIKKLEKRKEKLGSLETWIKSGQSDIYCIRGDAGTGKSTFLHYLKNKYYNYNIFFEIIDIQKATEEIPVLRKRIIIPNFTSLYCKAISAILHNVINSLFVKDTNGKLNYHSTWNRIRNIVDHFDNEYRDYYPREEVTSFFDALSQDINGNSDYRSFCENTAGNVESWIKQTLTNTSLADKTKFTIMLEVLIYYLICARPNSRHMITFDNFERFIGTDEIYDGQLTEFVSSFRTIQKSIADINNKVDDMYQIIVFMRNTSVRMFTSQQVTEFFPHDIDLSDWFDVGSVVKKKIEWYLENDIPIDESENLLNIFNDMGECGETLRGLHFKISMLFNYNKRIVIEFIARVLLYTSNRPFIEIYESLWENKICVERSLNKFAARSIIYRLTLNALRDDGFFVNIVAQCPPKSTCEGMEFNSLGCARKILTILYLHDLNCAHNADSRYLPFEQLISRLFAHSEDSLQLLFDNANQEKLETIVQVLFYMNYYNARKDNWLQFIDLQYDSCNEQNIVISDPSHLKQYIQSNPENIKIRITNAGKAYLYFVVYYFEFFSCKSINKTHQKQLFANKDMPPLLSCIPTIDEITQENTEALTCIKIIKVVLEESLSCISSMNNSENQILFRFSINNKYISHQQRIVNSHRGYLDNFVEYIKQLYENEYRKGESVFVNKFDKLIQTIIDLRNKYIPDYRKE